MPSPLKNREGHPAFTSLMSAYPDGAQGQSGSDVQDSRIGEVLGSLHLYYVDPVSGGASRVETQEDFEKTEVFNKLDLLYRGDTSLPPPPTMDAITASLSEIDRRLEEKPETLKALPDTFQTLLLSVAKRVQDLRSQNEERLPPPEPEQIKERWATRDKALKESPLDFVERAYAKWIGKGLERGHLKHVDQKLYKALENWVRKPGNSIPESVLPNSYTKHGEIIPSKEEQEIYNKISALYARSSRLNNKKIG